MKLIFVIDSLGTGGKERRCLQLIKGLNALGITNIHLVLFDNIIGYKNIYDLQVTIHHLNRRKSKDLQVFKKLINIIEDVKPDVIVSWSIMSSFWLNIIHTFKKFNLISAYVASSNKPSIISLTTLININSFITSRYIVGNSSSGLKAFSIPKNKSKLIYNGFDSERLIKVMHPEFYKNEFNIQTKFIVTMAARVCLDKDYQTFIDAARMILLERTDTTFLAIGEGPLLHYFKSQLSEFESNFIKFTGVINDIESILSMTDVSVLCSNHGEGISNFILESMAFSKPVIATNLGGTPEIVEHNRSGYLIPSHNPTELKVKITKLLDDPLLRHNFGCRSSEIVDEKFSLEKMCESFLKIFVEISK